MVNKTKKSTNIVRNGQGLTGRPVRLQDIADHLGISKCSVSLALRGREPISLATRELVQATAAALGYQASAHESARRLSLQKQGKSHINHIIGLFMITPTVAMNYFGHIYHGVLNGLMDEEFGLLTLHSTSYITAPDESSLWSIFTRGDVDGVIIGHSVSPDLIDRLRANPGFGLRPIVRLMSGSVTENLVRGDDQQGGYLATRYMLERGHRYFLHFKYPYENPLEVIARMDGIREALREWRLPVETHLITFPNVWKWNNPDTAPHSIEELSGSLPNDVEAEEFIVFLRKKPQITAIFGVNDANALHAWRALHHAGYRVPDDYSLVGFDDTDSLLSLTRHNLLSSIRVPLLDIGRVAAHLAVRLVQSQVSEPTIQIMPLEFIPRASIGPVRIG